MRLNRFPGAFILLLLFIAPGAAAQRVDCGMVEHAVDIAAEIRKLDVKKAVPCELQSRDQVEKYLRDTLNKKIPPERIANEGKVYELLGIVPPGFDYLNSIIKLYTDQLGGYYDTDRAAYVMASWLPAAMQMPIAVHELTHALQDQHYKLDELMDETRDDSDKLMSRSGLVEGDATAVMLDYARRSAGQGPIEREPDVSAFMLQNITGAMLTAGVSSAPPALQAMLIFPYVSGLRFAHELLRSGGYAAIDKAYKRPPESTEEILHPEIYLKGKKSFEKPQMPGLPPESGADPEKPIFEDRLGEFAISTLLSSYVPPLRASTAAAGWGGDRLWLFNVGEGRHLLVWRFLWDSEKDAKEFFNTFVEAYEKRFSRNSNGDASIKTFDDTPIGTVELKRAGKTVDLLIR